MVGTLPEATSLVKAIISESGGGRDAETNSSMQALGASYAQTLNCGDTDVSALYQTSETRLNNSRLPVSDQNRPPS
jgi:hypothetical protein